MFAHFPLNRWLIILFCLDVRHNIYQLTNQRYAKKATVTKALQ